uniref:Putative tRNA (Uracil-O(2)-)-methyltransferase n=1 Tax=Ceratitis capitata TaxID=7213 RepID=W8C276_CERCA
MDTSPAFLTETEFWTGVTVLIRNYHAVNKKIFACVFQKVIRLNEGIGKESDKYICESSNLTKVEETVGLGYKSSEAEIESVLYNLVANNESSVDCEGFIIFYKFLTKKLQNNIEAVGKIDLSPVSTLRTIKCGLLKTC